MENSGLFFYNTSVQLNGLIGKNDVVIIKVNCQWPERGGTNTDLVKSIITKIVNHPEGFTGEVVVADSGQGRGSLDWANSNAFNISQSMQDVVEDFGSHKVSTFLWDTIRTTTSEYENGNFEDGYIVNRTVDPTVDLCLSYPKFKTQYNTCISFKNGIWSNLTSSYDSKRLKVINVPVLKSHPVYGVTGCVKHYMGVPYQRGYGYRNAHYSIRLGAMGTLMAKIRFPTLNILDAIWVNSNPLESGDDRGPQTAYEAASFTNTIGASLDPVAMDYWASKHILIPAAIHRNHTVFSSLDPDYAPISSGPTSPAMIESFHNYLRRSMNILKESNHQVTMNETEITVQVALAGSIHNMNTGLNHGTIQEAINYASERDTIFVRDGIYCENVVVNKSVSLVGENRDTTIVDGGGLGHVISITSNNVNLTGFTIQNSSTAHHITGINLNNVDHCNISGNIITGNKHGIEIHSSSRYNTISGNNITDNDDYGIIIDGSDNNSIFGNNIANNTYGISIQYGSQFNSAFRNVLANNDNGIWIQESSTHNEFYHNKFLNNIQQVTVTTLGSTNYWDDGHPYGGNYWSDYNGTDIDGNGIGDTPYDIDENNQDNYPFMSPFISLEEIRAQYYDLLSTYHAIISELHNIRNIMRVFIATTIVLITTIVYIVIRKRRARMNATNQLSK
jgi:parallel beta-helix repeat protein